MMRSIHYLVWSPSRLGTLLYASEVDKGYQSVGSFFMLGNQIDDIDNEYKFPAVRDSKILEVKLVRQRSGSIYTADVKGVGYFQFRATMIGVMGLYGGATPSADGAYCVRQLAITNHAALDAAVRDHDFYFVGSSPMVKDAA